MKICPSSMVICAAASAARKRWVSRHSTAARISSSTSSTMQASSRHRPTRPAKAMAPFFTASWGVMFSSLPPLSSPVTPSAPVWSSSRAAVLRTVSGVPTICWRATVS